MEGFMGSLAEFWESFGFLVKGTVVVLLVALGMSLLDRVLRKSSQNVPGNKFRNQLIMVGASFAALIIIILGLPLDKSTQSQLLTLLGILISAAIALSGSTMLSNAMAGIMLKSVRNFRSGDFIQVGDHFGRVTERGLFHTEIQTPERDLTTLPNLLLATTAVNVIRTSGTIISANLSLGYDVPHTRIEGLLLKAAEGVGLEEPFVQIMELGDFSVTYRVAGLLTETKQMLSCRSRLRAAVLDVLHGDGIEIVSPDFTNARVFKEERTFIPAQVAAPAPTQDSAPVDVIFDKAEEAESLSRLEFKLQEKLAELDEVKKQLSEAQSDEEKETLKGRVASLEKVKEALQKAILKKQSEEEKR
jgi:small conductance mechanosensitive channel